MTDNQLLHSLTDSSLFDTYLLYGIIGLLIFIALIGLIILLITSCCCCFYSTSCCFCCYHRHRHLSYKLNEKVKNQENTNTITVIKRHSSDVTDFSRLYDSYPHLINNKAMIKTGINNRSFDTSCTTINTLISPISSCDSLRSFIDSVPPVQNNLIDKTNISVNRPFAYVKNRNDRLQILRPSKPYDRSYSPAAVSIDITRISSPINDNQTNSSSANIYETVIPTTNINSSSDRSTPIYETEWTHNLKKLIMSKIPSTEKNVVSVIKLPSSSSSSSDIAPSTHYFQQQQHPYDKVLANRTKTSDSMRRANMLKGLKDDAAFLY